MQIEAYPGVEWLTDRLVVIAQLAETLDRGTLEIGPADRTGRMVAGTARHQRLRRSGGRWTHPASLKSKALSSGVAVASRWLRGCRPKRFSMKARMEVVS